eukprot:4777312-Alexandrium_andersonii.AAC.1
MSASLVGSEMCIRDRVGDPPDSVPSPGVCRAKGIVLRARICGWGSQSVSYTHLTLPTICSV